jgi:enolase-phosphatase E1
VSSTAAPPLAGLRPAGILTDIEGTTTPIAFVHDVLFPYAAARLADFVLSGDPILNEVPVPRLETLQGWMARDEKIPVLKAIQGMIWDAGYRSGAIKGVIYDDVPPALRLWTRAGVRHFVYSSGSVAAQRLLFGFSEAGDLTQYFQGFFDTGVGPKRAPASYHLICRGANISPGEFLFLSDVEAELDAAAQAGLLTCQLVRAGDGTVASTRHATAADFRAVATRFALPHG